MDQTTEGTAPASVAPPNAAGRLFAGGGEVGAILAGIDWARTPLGPVETWPQTLRTSVRICLTSRHDIILWWGPDLLVFYNDAYAPTLGIHHPAAAGRPGREVWAEIWDVIGPMLEGVLRTGQPTWSYDQLLYLERNGYPEETYHTYSYSPIEDDNGNVGGVFTAVTETTLRVLAERRSLVARDLAAAVVDARTAEEVCARAARTLASDPHDIPFAILYLLDREGTHARLAASTGLAPGSRFAPAEVDLGAESAAADAPAEPGQRRAPQRQPAAYTWPLSQVAHSRTCQVVTDLPAWPCPTAPSERSGLLPRAVVLPVTEPGQPTPSAILVVGVNPHRALDDDYERFYELLASHLASALASAHAYEEERRRAEALAAIDRAKTVFFSNVSHEFRTPLTLMLSPLQDLLARGDGLPDAARAELDRVHRNGLRLLKLVNSLLDFSRIEAGRTQASFVPTDLAALTSDLASVFRSVIERAGLRYVIDCPPLEDLPEPVYVDREMWEKVVLNLLSNAFKFTFAGTITVALRQVGSAVELRVSDTGTGIPAAELPRLFERFHRVQGARSRSYEGSGIGLALVQELVHLHGGTISAQSTPGEGTTFAVRLPLGTAHLPAGRGATERQMASTALGAAPFVDEARSWLPEATDREPGHDPGHELRHEPDEALGWQHAAGEPPAPEGAQQARILLADDNADMRDYLRRLLGERYEVQPVANGAEALAAARERLPDLVLSDVMMPELDGFALLRALRADPQTAEIPIILVSARAGEEATIEGLQAGADDYLVKPFSAREVHSRVAARLEIARARRESAERLRAILDLLPVGVAFVDAAGRAEIVNQQVRAIWGGVVVVAGSSADAGADAGTYTAWWPETGRPVAAEEWGLARALATGEVSIGEEIEIEAADGTRKTILNSNAPLHDGSGAIVGGMSVIVDITERKRLERNTREALDALLRMAETLVQTEMDVRDTWAEGLPAPTASPAGQRIAELTRRVVNCEVAAIVLFDHDTLRLTPVAVVGLAPALERRWWTDVPRTTLDEYYRPDVVERLRAGETVLVDLAAEPLLNGADYGVRRVLIVPMLIGEHVMGLFPIEHLHRETPYSDEEVALVAAIARLAALVIERDRLLAEREEARARMLALQDANARMDDFLGIASHELRTPLTSITANVQLAVRQLRALSRGAGVAADAGLRGRLEQSQQLLERTDRQMLRLDRLVGDLLDVARIQAGRLDMRPEPCDLLEIVREAVKEQRAAWPRRSITLDLPRRADLTVHADPDRIGQVVTNYLTNALKYSPQEQPVAVRVRMAGAQGERVRVEVRDAGPGLSAAQREHLFERFYRVPGIEQQSGSGVGLGLGLHICQTIVERHGGQVGLESVPGEGSAFWFTLPGPA